MPLRSDQTHIEKAAHYRRQAQVHRDMASGATSEWVAEQLLDVAAEYDRLADRLEASLKRS
jgi:hypothetical protein